MPKIKDLITAVEIGTESIKVFCGAPEADETMAVLGFCELQSANRVRKGVVVNATAVTELLSEAFNKVEQQIDDRIRTTYMAVTGMHIDSVNVQGSVPVTTPDRVITEAEVIEAARLARDYKPPRDQIAINSFQRTFLIDGERRTSQPIGMVGSKLTADVHFIFGDYNVIQTQCNLLEDALGFPANDIAFSGIADYYGLKSADEPCHGVLVINIGAGVTDYSLFYELGCAHSGTLAVGTDHVANDLAIGLRLSPTKGRELLHKHGCARRKTDAASRFIEVKTTLADPPKKYSEDTVQTIIEARLQEIFDIIRRDLDDHDALQLISEDILLCGGGALIPEISELASSSFHMPARVGYPLNVSGTGEEVNSPRFVTPIGLLHLGNQLRKLDDRSALPLKEQLSRDVRTAWSLFKRGFQV